MPLKSRLSTAFATLLVIFEPVLAELAMAVLNAPFRNPIETVLTLAVAIVGGVVAFVIRRRWRRP